MKFSVRKVHRPIHIYTNQYIYFITIRTLDRIPYFNARQKKLIVINCINSVIKRYKTNCFAWVILNNHYHILVKFKEQNDLPFFMRDLNGRLSREINIFDNMKGRKLFNNYWDYCIRNEADFWRHFNYIHNNPIKHKYISNPNKLHKYEFSSYHQWIRRKGKEWLFSCFEEYPILDFTIEND